MMSNMNHNIMIVAGMIVAVAAFSGCITNTDVAHMEDVAVAVTVPKPTFDATYPITVIFEWECGGIWMLTFENEHTATSINIDSSAHGKQPCQISVDNPSMRKYIIDQGDNNCHIVLYRGGLVTYQSGDPGSLSGDGKISKGRWY